MEVLAKSCIVKYRHVLPCRINGKGPKTEVSVTSILAAVGGQINQLCVSYSVPRHEGGKIHHQLDHLFSGKNCCALHTFYNHFQLLQLP
ncbi:hypothetical protein Peur_053976 [Populus x canadensis]